MRALLTRLGVSFVVLSLAAACGDTPTTPSGATAFTQTDLTVGAGAAAVTGNTLTVNYTGWLYDGSKSDKKGLQFDTSVGRAPFIFTLGTGQVIAGWDQGLVSLRVGGVRRLIIPPSLGYGAVRNGPIPPNASLVFDIELTDVK
ncbi:MAG: FKBP-type peptidyl-prolyl cis-trans isomerase [Acidobacteria bacterium]|nr:FKBP-type peptidyl-prolyl cis-trans isomerase [Acidobacteriota bacterium]